MPTWSITVEVARDDAERTAAEFFEAGASGIEERDAGVAPMPGSPLLAAGKALLVAWFQERGCAESAAGAVAGARMVEVADQDWGEAWKAGLEAFSVGRIFVRPSWVSTRSPPGAVEVVLDPGMAFGTGTHPTTALCLQALGDAVAARRGLSVLDVGTGSGLLAIAARKLGAGRVVGSDNDPVAVRVARENAQRNGASIELTGADVPAVSGPFDLVVANILANTLVELAPALAGQVAPGGTLLLSGLLVGQEEQVRAPYWAAGLVHRDSRRQGEWLLVAFSRPEGRGLERRSVRNAADVDRLRDTDLFPGRAGARPPPHCPPGGGAQGPALLVVCPGRPRNQIGSKPFGVLGLRRSEARPSTRRKGKP